MVNRVGVIQMAASFDDIMSNHSLSVRTNLTIPVYFILHSLDMKLLNPLRTSLKQSQPEPRHIDIVPFLPQDIKILSERKRGLTQKKLMTVEPWSQPQHVKQFAAELT